MDISTPAAKSSSVGCATSDVSQMKDAGISAVPADVWVDSRGYVVQEKFSATLDTAASGSSTPVIVGYTSTVSHIGDPVTITPPPPDQVQPVATALQNGTLT